MVTVSRTKGQQDGQSLPLLLVLCVALGQWWLTEDNHNSWTINTCLKEDGKERARVQRIRHACMCGYYVFVFSLQQSDLRFSGTPSGQGAGGGARTRDRRVLEDLRADSLANGPPTPP
ncbi:hypothetical protein PoB_000258700 [Plakobranchus ocellatus]|uniref:Uncharacterized protein n=1 Tax=Plakobranchus ocellatus TaxID=259542 RepID=A0AAV3XZZ0_9GAST|nr:hypothetical protein PoB_000258700 [Plakobranchus ocellatus]